MGKIDIRTGDWVVVCDGRKALILENLGDAKFPNLRMKHVREQEDAPTRELGSDAPGRTNSSTARRRSAYAQTDFHDKSERDFLVSVAQDLDGALSGTGSRSFFVVAPPRALHVLREAYTPAVRQAVRTEIDKDWVNMPIEQIERQLVG